MLCLPAPPKNLKFKNTYIKMGKAKFERFGDEFLRTHRSPFLLSLGPILPVSFKPEGLEETRPGFESEDSISFVFLGRNPHSLGVFAKKVKMVGGILLDGVFVSILV